jgi:hypothetical protein
MVVSGRDAKQQQSGQLGITDEEEFSSYPKDLFRFDELKKGTRENMIVQQLAKQIGNPRNKGLKNLLWPLLVDELINYGIKFDSLHNVFGPTYKKNPLLDFDARNKTERFLGTFAWIFEGIEYTVHIGSMSMRSIAPKLLEDFNINYTVMKNGYVLKITHRKESDGKIEYERAEPHIYKKFEDIYENICVSLTRSTFAYFGNRIKRDRLVEMLRRFDSGKIREYNGDGTPAKLI